MISPSVDSNSAPNSNSAVNPISPAATEHEQPASNSHHPQVQGLGANNQSLMGGMWANAKWLGGEALGKYGALTSWAGSKVLGPAVSDEQLSQDERLDKKHELLGHIALLEHLINAQKNQANHIPLGSQALDTGDIIKKLKDDDSELQERYNVVRGVFKDPVTGIEASILKNAQGEIVIAFADNKKASNNADKTFVSRAVGLLHKKAVSEPNTATLKRAKALVKGVLEKYPGGKIVLTGHGSGADLVSSLKLTHTQGDVSKVILNTASGLEATHANYTAQLNRLIDATFNQKSSVNGVTSRCWKGEGTLPHQVKINSVGDAVVVGTASFGVGLLFGGPLAAAVSGLRTAVSYGVQGLPWYTYTLSRQNAIQQNRGLTDSFTEAVLGNSTKLLGSVKHASGLSKTEGLLALNLSEIPEGFKQNYNVVDGIFEDKKTGNKISILKDVDGTIVFGFAGVGDSFWHHLAEDVVQEFKGVGAGTHSYTQAAKLLEGMLGMMNTKRGVKSNIVLTGHSRWGGVVQKLMTGAMAQEAIDNHQLTAYVFNSVGMSHATRQQHSEEVWNKAGNSIVHVKVDNDWLTQGLQHTSNGPTSSQVVAGATLIVKAEGGGPLGGHSLTAIERGLNAKKHELDNAL